MNLNQKLAIVAALIGIVAVILYPPFYVKLLGGVIQNGHHLIFDRPHPLAKVDVVSVVVRALVIAVVGGIAVVALGRKK